MNLRLEAESRVQRQRFLKTRELEKQSSLHNMNRRPRRNIDIDTSFDSAENLTPKIAALAGTDFSLNGNRARCDSGEFVGPRRVPDAECLNCFLCNSEFDWWTRRHHCRHCGRIFCGHCSIYQSLLPYAFGLRDPQRVCRHCHDVLLPMQISLTNNIANHQRANTIDIVSYSIRRYLNFPISLTLGSEIRKAGYTAYNLCRQLQYIRDKTVPLGLLAGAKGLAFITVLKGGFMIAPHFGTGLIVARLPTGDWSAPSAIGTIGISYGPLIGAEIVDYVIILSSEEAVNAFAGGGQVSLGASIDLAIGPLGRSGSVDMHFGDGGCAPAYTYSHSRGLYAGVTLEGSVLFPRSDVNHRFYGRVVTPMELLQGAVPPPRAARPLYDALQEALAALPQPTYSCFPVQPLAITDRTSGTYDRTSGTPGSYGSIPYPVAINFNNPNSNSNRNSTDHSNGQNQSQQLGAGAEITSSRGYFGNENDNGHNGISLNSFESTFRTYSANASPSAASSQQSSRAFFSIDGKPR